VTEKTEKQTADEAWREVGRQFQTLGESLAEAVRTAWESEGTRRHVQNMQGGLEAMAAKVDQAIKEASASPKAEKLRGEAEKAAESLREAGEQTWQEVQPHLLSALNQINAELQKMIGRLKGEEPTAEAPAAEAAPDEPESE
jgi:DNA polymerase/3'-5' exonuclease PolX